MPNSAELLIRGVVKAYVILDKLRFETPREATRRELAQSRYLNFQNSTQAGDNTSGVITETEVSRPEIRRRFRIFPLFSRPMDKS